MGRLVSAWLAEATVIEIIAERATAGDVSAARALYLDAVQCGAIDTRGRREAIGSPPVYFDGVLMRPFIPAVTVSIPPEDWMTAQWWDCIPDPQMSGFFFGVGLRWYNREARVRDVEAIWPRGNRVPADDPRRVVIREAFAAGETPGKGLNWNELARRAIKCGADEKGISPKQLRRLVNEEIRRRPK
jgi:hypothetical protein